MARNFPAGRSHDSAGSGGREPRGDGPHLDLPPAVTLALWLGADLPCSRTTARTALAAAALASGHELPVEQLLADADDPAALPGLLVDLGRPAEVAALMPAPGDPMGVPPGVATPDGQVVTLRHGPAGERTLLLAPEILAYGSNLEPGVMFVWSAQVPDAERRPVFPFEGLGQARRDVAHALAEAIDALEHLDVARTRPDLADALTDVSVASLRAAALPPGLDQRRVDVLQSAARILAIVELALSDDGAAVTAGQAAARRAALAPVERAARRALSTASAHARP